MFSATSSCFREQSSTAEKKTQKSNLTNRNIFISRKTRAPRGDKKIFVCIIFEIQQKGCFHRRRKARGERARVITEKSPRYHQRVTLALTSKRPSPNCSEPNDKYWIKKKKTCSRRLADF